MNYEKRIISAIEKTKELGLELSFSPYPFTKPLSHEEKRQALQLCVDVLYSKGYRQSSDLASNCTPVHLDMQHFLKSELNLDSYITIGDRYWDDYVYCEMSYENIKCELNSPDFNNPIKAHVWLTLSDGTILDCTAEAHADLLYKRGEHPIEKCLMLVEASNIENAKSGYHRPYLIGADFLQKAGVCGKLT
ncbi:hypothetical protein [Shewanella violacea]|uniref:Uncharacterized protein n=1 Tax=Shewanella violacea (strain JCM 10179 / CIP 106290 / LMG 19151 / DSS12) TaxID=637905 RepID=D4ZHL5_SHEVD|nr:hypothetical protein [Shewanella violacea]BAJ01164.1 hypothetical protein SVI_1193 [Shewanella violacea DSS12]